MINVHLHGALANAVTAEPLRLAVDRPRMMFRGLEANYPTFEPLLRHMARDGRKLGIVCFKADLEEPYSVQAWELNASFPVGTTDVHLVPEVEGAGIETIAAAIVSAMGVTGTAATIATFLVTVALNVAVSAVLGAIAQSLAPSADTSGNGNEKPSERGSLIFNGPVNTVAQGGAIPVVYGECMTGSVVISAGVSVEEIPV